jgi:aminomethyltransferase
MKKTPLFDLHCSLNAKMAPFGGFEMPIQYEGIIAEHHATRKGAALFDTCHMGEFRVSGPRACADLDRLLTCDVAGLKIGRCRNGFMCNERGGVIDDLIVYRFADHDFMVVVNAGTQETDFEWIIRNLSPDTVARNIGPETAKVDLQGPGAPRIFMQLVNTDISDIKPYQHRYFAILGEKILASRTGYTGEIGFEIYCTNAHVADVWRECMRLGARPAGLGARDTLRLEMCLPLYGHELNEERNVACSGFDKLIAADKEFIGSGAVRHPAAKSESLAAILLDGRRAARSGDAIADVSGTIIGIVTSGSFGPSIGRAAALGYVRSASACPGTRLMIRTAAGNQELPAAVVEKPFYKGSTTRREIKEFI